MKTVKEVSKIAGVSVRTLHHYDAIGLLKPTAITQAGYRLYDDAAIGRLQSILLFRELKFPLKEIKAIFDNPQFDMQKALSKQIELLEMEYERLGKLIAHAYNIQEKGEYTMDFSVFDATAINAYREEVAARWSGTKAYEEYCEKEKAGEILEADSGLMVLLGEIGKFKTTSPEDTVVQEKISNLKDYITAHYYTCTPDILKCLGQMYMDDLRFKQSIDRAGGEGCAAFVNKAIMAYCASNDK